MKRTNWVWVAVVLCASGAGAHEFGAASTAHVPHAFASHVVVPQMRSFAVNGAGVAAPATVEITAISADVNILEEAAETTLEVSLRNPTSARQEAEVLLPVPEGAVVRAFTFQGNGAEPSAKLLPRDEARSTYQSIVAKVKDPALLEFVGYNLIRSSVFPVEPNGTQKIRLVYEHLCPVDGSRLDYVLPRSEMLDYKTPWTVNVRVRSKRTIATVYSPSHELDIPQRSANHIVARTTAAATREPGSFRLSCVFAGDGVSASLFAYPDPKIGGGYFLLLAGVPAGSASASPIKREVTIVIDRSGSMNGEKIQQVREAALQVVAGLNDGEAFNIIPYNESVESFSQNPVIKSRETENAARAYIKGINASGGTNIHDALLEALRQKATEGFLPIVIFLTDGLPTVGQTAETTIRELATKANPQQRRVFTFGVGVDVNTPLLDKIASATRATTAVVMPKEDVEVKVGGLFKRLAGPVLANPKLLTTNEVGKVSPGRVRDMVPSLLPDVFDGDQIVLLGQYVGEAPLHFALSGNYLGTQRTFSFNFPLDNATTRNAFVPRLWASRRIAVLCDAIREMGADKTVAAGSSMPMNPRAKELIDEVVKLSKEFGVLTEYTAFLALEGTDLSKPETVFAQASDNFHNRAWATRSGAGSWNQDFNKQTQIEQKCMNYGNAFFDEKLNRVSISSVQQVSDRTFYRRDNRWVDSRVIEQDKAQPKKIIAFGSDDFLKLTERLAKEGRQGCVSLRGEVLLQVDGEMVLVK
jgi:Ca-activated chloride channel family protein